MERCRVGIISKSVCKRYVLRLGEIIDEKICKNVILLYKIHNNLKYISNFKVKIDKTGILFLDNIEEIISFQNMYRLSKRISIDKKAKDCFIRFNKPEIYDISCMVPLFTYTRQTLQIDDMSDNFSSNIVILFPIINPVKRGKLIEKCLDVCKGSKVYFYLLGGKQGKNSTTTKELAQRYLDSIGNHNTILSVQDKFPDSLYDAFDMFDFFVSDNVKNVYITLPRKSIQYVMKYIRKMSSSVKKRYKIQLLSN